MDSLPRKNRGFTLMELVVVVIIIAVMFAVALPRLRGMNEKNKIRSSARELVTLMKYARSEAVFNERTTGIFLDSDKREYWLDLRTPDPETGEVKQGAKKTQFEIKRPLSKNLMFEAIQAQDSDIINNKIIAVDFFPDGTASPVILTLLDTNTDVRMTVEVLRSTGMVELSAGSMQEKAENAEEMPLPGSASGGSI